MHAEELYAQGYAQLQPPLNESTGVLAGGELSINVGDNTKFDMAAGVYVFVDFTYDPVSPQRTFVPKEAVTAQTVTNLGTQLVTYVGVDVTGAIIQSATPFTDTQRRTIAQVGVLVHSNLTNLNAVNDTAASVRSGISQLHDLITAIGPLNVTGNTVSANGANLNINKSAGSVFKLGCNFQTNPLDPHTITLAALVAPTNLRYRTSTSVETANTAVIDPTQYESSPGVLTPLSSSSKYSVQRLSVFTSNLIRIQWGQHEYGSLAEAENAIPTESFAVEANIAENGIFIGYLIVRKNCTDLSDTTDAKFISVGKFGNPASSGVALTSTDELPEGVTNLYFTDARAQAAVVTASITNGDTTHSPSGDAVFDALALKANLSGATFSGPVQINSTLGVTGLSTLGAATFSGAAQVNSTLGVTGLSTLATAINVGSLQSTKAITTALTPSWQENGAGALTAAQNSSFGLFRWSGDAAAPGLYLSKSRGATQGTHTVAQTSDVLGRIGFMGSDGSAFFEAARIEALVSSSPASGSVPGMLVLSTTAIAGASATAALTLNGDQSALFGAYVTVPTTLVVGNTGAIPANTRVLIDRIGTGTLPTLPGGTALTLQGNNSASNNNYLVNIAGASGSAGIRFGDSASANQGRIDYDNATDGFLFYTNNASAMTLSSAAALSVVGAGRFNGATQGFLGVLTGSSGATANTNRDELVIEASGASGISILSPGAEIVGIAFGDPGNSTAGQVRYNHSTDEIALISGGTVRLTADATAVAIAGSMTIGGGITGANIYNTYTPTLTGITNVSSTAANSSGWIRIGNAVLVFTRLTVTATASGALTEVSCSLPVASNFSNANQCVGTGGIISTTTEVGVVGVQADTVNDVATLRFVSTNTAARVYTVVFGYIVI